MSSEETPESFKYIYRAWGRSDKYIYILHVLLGPNFNYCTNILKQKLRSSHDLAETTSADSSCTMAPNYRGIFRGVVSF